MIKLITVKRAEEEIKRLQHYIDLVESYEADTLEKWIIKEYCYTNSMGEVIKRANARGYTYNGMQIDRNFVKSVINAKANDELHWLLKSGYKQKIRPNKRVISERSY